MSLSAPSVSSNTTLTLSDNPLVSSYAMTSATAIPVDHSIYQPTSSTDCSLAYRINAIQEEMNRRNNLGYGLGVFFGRLLGTRTEDEFVNYETLEVLDAYKEGVEEEQAAEENDDLDLDINPESESKFEEGDAQPEEHQVVEPLQANETGSNQPQMAEEPAKQSGGWFSWLWNSAPSQNSTQAESEEQPKHHPYQTGQDLSYSHRLWGKTLRKFEPIWDYVFSIMKFNRRVASKARYNKLAIEFLPMKSHNKAFDKDDLITRYNDVALFKEGFEKLSHQIEDTNSICDILFEKYHGRKFKLLSFSTHGSSFFAQYGSKAKTSLTEQPTLNVGNVERVLHCLPQYLTDDAKVIFRSCSTGDITKLPFYEKMLPEDPNFGVIKTVSRGLENLVYGFRHEDNIALATYRFLSKHFPNIEVAAPGLDTHGSYIQSVEPLEVVAPSRYNKKGYINSGLVYNKDSVALIDKGRELQELAPDVIDKFIWGEDGQYTDRVAQHVSDMGLALRFTPKDDRVRDSYLYSYLYFDANVMVVEMIVSLAAFTAATAATAGTACCIGRCVVSRRR